MGKKCKDFVVLFRAKKGCEPECSKKYILRGRKWLVWKEYAGERKAQEALKALEKSHRDLEFMIRGK